MLFLLRVVLRALLIAIFNLRDATKGKKLTKESPLPARPAPDHLNIEVTNLCNANCTFCGYQYQERPISFLPFDLFAKAVTDYAKMGGGPLGLTPVVGDSLIDKDLVKKIAVARSIPEISDIRVTTNGILLTKKLFNKMVENGLTHLCISMSGFNRNEYKRVYRNDSYQKLTNNLEQIALSDSFAKCTIDIAVRTDRLFPWMRKDYWRFRRMGYSISSTTFFDNWSGRIHDKDLSGAMFIWEDFAAPRSWLLRKRHRRIGFTRS